MSAESQFAAPRQLQIAGHVYMHSDLLTELASGISRKWRAEANAITAAKLRGLASALGDRIVLPIKAHEAEFYGRTVNAIREVLERVAGQTEAEPVPDKPVAVSVPPEPRLPLKVADGEAFAVDPANDQKTVASMSLNPNGWPTITLYSDEGLPL